MGLHDMKEMMTSARKADTTHVRKHFQDYAARPCEYGIAKGYARGNYLRATGGEAHDEPTAADFDRLRVYLRAARGHIDDVLQSMEQHQANDPNLTDVDGMRRAAYAIDLDVKPGSDHPASHLPHVAPACSSLMMAIEQAVACGLLPADPGRPWESPVNARADYAPITAEDRAYEAAAIAHAEAAALQHDVERNAKLDAFVEQAHRFIAGEMIANPSAELVPLNVLKKAGADGADKYAIAREEYEATREQQSLLQVPPYGGRW